MEVFRVPRVGQNELSLIRTECEKLEIVSKAKIDTSGAIECNLAALMKKLTAHVEIDTAENTTSLDSGVKFEFVSEVNPHGELRVLTRLFSADPTQTGGILYGPKVIRTEKDSYLFWPE